MCEDNFSCTEPVAFRIVRLSGKVVALELTDRPNYLILFSTINAADFFLCNYKKLLMLMGLRGSFKDKDTLYVAAMRWMGVCVC